MDSKKLQLPTSTGQSLEKISRLLGINLSSYVGRLYTFILIVLFSMLSQMSWNNNCTGYDEEHLIKKFMVTLEYILYFFLVLTTMGTSIFRPKQFAFPLQEMFIIDTIFELYGVKFSKKDIFLAHLQDAAIMIVALLVMMKYAYDIIATNSYQLICYFLQSWYSIVCLLFMDGLFTHYINDMYLRFRELNKIAIQRSKENLSIIYVDFIANLNMCNEYSCTVVTKIRLIQHIHHGLYILATKINTNFGLQLLIISIICFNAIIILLHDMYHNMKTDSENNEILIFNMIFIFCYGFRLLYISFVCQRSKNEFNQMGIILHDVFLEYKSMQSEVIHFSLQLIHEDLTFTAFGLYEINISLICSITGAVVTYLVMVIQLDTPTKFANHNVTTT
ncbi:putative gustatory receptor 28a [Camponotus floridanus]|uniref:putative gustatory receptor 28a n=1 Tax=Camponotus floridanus TaxID=104421 RepID=UPI000DC68567|nr:putative gustatory receptor 28a [Camponotus floridanus]